MSNQINFSQLAAPFAVDDIEFRAGATDKEKTKALALAYITSRAVMNRLDEVVGPANWKDEYRPGPDGGVICGLSLRLDGEWVCKWDGAENTNFEAVKGGLSDAFKRVAVKWGIGRYLYNTPDFWVPCHERGKTVVLDQNAARAMFTRAMNGQLSPSPASQGEPLAAPTASPAKPRPNGAPPAGQGQAANGNSNGKAADAMTAFWLAVKAKGLSREQGQAVLQQAGGDAAKALAAVQGS